MQATSQSKFPPPGTVLLLRVSKHPVGVVKDSFSNHMTVELFNPSLKLKEFNFRHISAFDWENKPKIDEESEQNIDAQSESKAEELEETVNGVIPNVVTAGSDAHHADADVIANADVDAEAETDANADAEAETEANANADADANVNAEAEDKAKADTQAETEANADAEAKAKADADADADAEANAEANAEADAEAKADAGAETEVNANANAEANADAEAETEAKADADANAEANAEADVNAEADADPDADGKLEESDASNKNIRDATDEERKMEIADVQTEQPQTSSAGGGSYSEPIFYEAATEVSHGGNVCTGKKETEEKKDMDQSRERYEWKPTNKNEIGRMCAYDGFVEVVNVEESTNVVTLLVNMEDLRSYFEAKLGEYVAGGGYRGKLEEVNDKMCRTSILGGKATCHFSLYKMTHGSADVMYVLPVSQQSLAEIFGGSQKIINCNTPEIAFKWIALSCASADQSSASVYGYAYLEPAETGNDKHNFKIKDHVLLKGDEYIRLQELPVEPQFFSGNENFMLLRQLEYALIRRKEGFCVECPEKWQNFGLNKKRKLEELTLTESDEPLKKKRRL